LSIAPQKLIPAATFVKTFFMQAYVKIMPPAKHGFAKYGVFARHGKHASLVLFMR
jgi:hypothetical protein